MAYKGLVSLSLLGSVVSASLKHSRSIECSNPVQGIDRDDCEHMASIGMAGLGDNALDHNGYIWVGDDGPNTFQFTNKASGGPITLILWDFPDTNYQSSFMNVNRPKISYSLPSPGDSVTVSIGNGISGGWSTLNGHKTTLSEFGQIQNTWGEFTTGSSATVDISRLVTMNGNSQTILVNGGCVSDMNACSFHCKDGLDQCGDSGSYELLNCDPSTNPNASMWISYDGSPEGGCMGWSDGGRVEVILKD